MNASKTRSSEGQSVPPQGGDHVLRAVFEGAMDAMVLADEQGVWVNVNPAAAELFGAPEAELIGRNLREFAAGTPAEVSAAWSQFLELGQLRGRFAVVRADGTVRQTDFSARANILPGLHLSILRDVTQVELAEVALRESRYFLEEAQAVAHVGSWVSGLEPHGRLQWSNECYRIFGLPVGSPITVQSFFDRVHDDDREAIRNSVARAIQQRTTHELEHRIVRPDGAVRWVFERAVVERDPDGGALRLIGVVQDVTERRAVLDELRASEQRYRRIIETTSEGAFTLDAHARITFVNQRMAQLLGCTAEAALGRSICELVEGEHKAAFERQIRSERPRSDAQYDLRLRRADRAPIWVSLSVSPLLDAEGRCEGATALVTDISERKRAEELGAQLVAVVEASDDAIVSANLEGCFTSWSQGAQRLFGYSATEVIGQPILMLCPPERLREQRELMARIRGGESMRNFETLRKGKHGTIPVALTISPIKNELGQVVGGSSILRDLTDVRRNEAALQKAEEQLRQVQKMEAIGRLAGGVAHDFNNLLSVILSYASMAHDGLDARDPLRQDLAEIKRAGGRAAELTRQLLAFSRRQMLKPEVLDLNAVVAGMERMLRRLLGEDIELSLLLAPDLGTTLADRGQIEQVVLNLAVNARDAMPSGGQLRLELANREREHAHGRDATAGWVQLRVSDTGLGMDEVTRARMFEPFFTTKPKGKGTGLGLSTVLGIVEQSGGQIAVTSEPDRGATFTILLPRSGLLSQEIQDRSAPSSLLGSETLLVVEDDEQVRRLACTVLLRHGYQVLAAANGPDALLLAARHNGGIALLVTDVIMPLMSGKQLADRLLAQRPGLRVLFMSGYTDDAIGHHGVLDAGTHFLPKPLSPEMLTRKVREVLDASQAVALTAQPTA